LYCSKSCANTASHERLYRKVKPQRARIKKPRKPTIGISDAQLFKHLMGVPW
jgi:hypothetical protein